MESGNPLPPADVTTAVRLKIPLTRGRRVSAFFFLAAPATVVVGLIVILASSVRSAEQWAELAAYLPWIIVSPLGFGVLMMTWIGVRNLTEVQTVTVSDGKLVSTLKGRLGPGLNHRVWLDELDGNSFAVREFPKDVSDTRFRPSFTPRVFINGKRGTPVFSAGIALTVDEAREARDALNRLVGAEPSSGVVAGDPSNKRIEQNASR